jgi:hypothetical protein
MNRADFRIDVGGEETEQWVFALDRLRLWAALAALCCPRYRRRSPTVGCGQRRTTLAFSLAWYRPIRRTKSTALHSGWPVAAKARQCGDLRVAYVGDGRTTELRRIPQRDITSSCTPSGAFRTTGAM